MAISKILYEVENFFFVSVCLLFVLAFIDLVEGVSNDAVNFLNSAIGSKVTSRRNILILASLGILFGAASSAGLMEVARKGIYNPEYFYFDEIIFICLAVMLTDIFLLNVFNSFALPTSTTVSLVFELLGAAFVMSIIKILSKEDPMNFLFNINDQTKGVVGFMNWESAGVIVSGIFLSILIAFVLGALVQYLSRLIFTHHFNDKLKYFGAIYGGFAVTILFYFLILSGLKNADEKVQNIFQYGTIKENTLQFLLILFVASSVFMQVLILTKVNIFKIIVLMGTFALAMAFAGNDLVNFIGVPISGFEAYKLWVNSGENASEFLMSGMQKNVPTPYLLLIVAGLIMVVTLWFSKKAKNVTDTEVNLGRQAEGEERFQPNRLSRFIVRATTKSSEFLSVFLPEVIKNKINKRLEIQNNNLIEGQAFDLVRASVNLVTASALIAFATQMKLPLSTTYVTFVVAMGTSLADKAWGRESAVYRVAGVLNIIGGWFLTAMIAFGVSGIFVAIIYNFHWIGVIAVLIFVIFTYFYFHNFYADFIKPKKANDVKLSMPEALGEVCESNISFLAFIKEIYKLSLDGLTKEDLKRIKSSVKSIDEQKQMFMAEREKILYLQNINTAEDEIDDVALSLHIKNSDFRSDLMNSLNNLVDTISKHILNSHLPLKKEQKKALYQLEKMLDEYIDLSSSIFRTRDMSKLDLMVARKKEIFETINKMIVNQTQLMKSGEVGFKNNKIMLSFCLESRDIAAVISRLAKQLKEFS